MAGIPILENVKDIYQIFQKQVTVFALPMKIKNGSGAPVRIVAVENYQICKSWMEFYLRFLYATCNYIFSKKILATVRRHERVEVASLQISLQIQKWQFGNLVEWWLWDYLEEKIFVKRKFPRVYFGESVALTKRILWNLFLQMRNPIKILGTLLLRIGNLKNSIAISRLNIALIVWLLDQGNSLIWFCGVFFVVVVYVSRAKRHKPSP